MQKDALQINNLDPGELCSQKKHGPLLPNTIRALVTGSSNCGKTNCVLSLIFEENGLKFNNVYLYSKSLYQPKYQFLQSVLDKVPEIKYFPFKDSDEIMDPSEACENSIFIFDDVACDKQDKIRSYFCMGRHKTIDSFYLCQTYARIPKHLVRDNANLLIIFRQDDLNLRHIYSEHVGADMTFDQFKSMCSECWKDKYGFLVIDKDSDIGGGRYRKGFDCYICL